MTEVAETIREITAALARTLAGQFIGQSEPSDDVFIGMETSLGTITAAELDGNILKLMIAAPIKRVNVTLRMDSETGVD